MKKIIVLILCLLLTGCTKTSQAKIESLSNYPIAINKIDNLSNEFIMGVDLSTVIAEEQSGVEYYGFDGEKEDIFNTLKNSGVTHIRIRIWNNPYDNDGKGFGGGNNDILKAKDIAQRAKKYNLKVILDFHYSDFWADPSKQIAPREWHSLNLEDKGNALYDFTYSSLSYLKENNIDNIDIIQIGNEIDNGLASETSWENKCFLLNKGIKAVNDFDKNIKTAVHFADVSNNEHNLHVINYLKKYNVEYDIFGASYYTRWQGDLKKANKQLNFIAKQSGKKVMILETAYPFTTLDGDDFANIYSSAEKQYYPFSVQGQADCVYDAIKAVSDVDDNMGIGICYWEPAWVAVPAKNQVERIKKWIDFGSGASTTYSKVFYTDSDTESFKTSGNGWDNQAMFDNKGKPLASLNVFKYVYIGT